MMEQEIVNYAKGETPMTDMQFTAYVELRDKYETLLQEATELRYALPQKADEPASDYQFQRYEQARDRCEELDRELTVLRRENAKLKIQIEMYKSSNKRIRV
jgi:hypothetical protein